MRSAQAGGVHVGVWVAFWWGREHQMIGRIRGCPAGWGVPGSRLIVLGLKMTMRNSFRWLTRVAQVVSDWTAPKPTYMMPLHLAN